MDSSVDLIFNLHENEYMLKILLVYDDFQELSKVELQLKKIGFDVVGITSEFSLAEQLLAFNPQIIVAQGRTAKVSSASVGRRLRESVRWDGKIVLVFYPNAKPQPTELLKIRMDVGIEYPVEPTKMIQVLAQLGGLDSNILLDKLIKGMTSESQDTDSDDATTYSSAQDRSSVYVSGSGTQEQKSSQKFGSGLNAKNENLSDESGLSGKSSQAISVSDAMEALSKMNVPGGPSVADVSLDLKGIIETPKSQNSSLNGKTQEREKPKTLAALSQSESEAQKLKSSFEINSQELNKLPRDPVMQELENLLQKKSTVNSAPPIRDTARHVKYQEYVKTIPVLEMSSIKRKEAKTRLKDLIKDLDKKGLEDQDVLRREYVKALFKKEG
jgi:DNA-binding response OmpR family regulator